MAFINSLVCASGGLCGASSSSTACGMSICRFGNKIVGAGVASALLMNACSICYTKLWVSASPCAGYGISGSWEGMGSVGKIGKVYVIGVEGGEEVVVGKI